MAYKCYYHKSSSSTNDFLSKLYGYLEAMGWVKTKGLELADAATFQTAHVYAQGDVVKPTSPVNYVYICSTAGTSAGSEPTWGTTEKAETTSNTAKFRCYLLGRVYSSQGESGAEPLTYVYLYGDNSTTTYCRIIGAIGLAQWIDSTWLCGCPAQEPITLSTGTIGNPCYHWMYGNKDIVVVAVLNGSTYYTASFGFFVPVWNTRTVLTAGATAGGSVNLAVASSVGFYPGQYVQMWGIAEEGRDRLLISAIPDSTHITITTLPRDYASGSWIGINPHTPIFVQVVSNAMNAASSYMNLYAVGTAPLAMGVTNDLLFVAQLVTESLPDNRLNKHLLQPAYFYVTDYSAGWLNAVGGYLPTAVVMVTAKAATALDLFLVYDGYVYPVSGTVTSGGATTLTDTGKSMTVDAWIDKILVITAGTGIGQTRNIISNTATEFTVNAWDTNPDATSVYAVVDEAWRALNGATNAPRVKEIL